MSIIFSSFLEPRVDFVMLRLYAEGGYIMRRSAVSFIPSETMKITAIISTMEAFQHVREKVEKTVHAIRHVRVRSGGNPKVPHLG